MAVKKHEDPEPTSGQLIGPKPKPPPPPPEPEPAKKKTTRGRSTKQKARDDAQKRYEKEIARIEAMRGRTVEAKEDLKKSAAKDREVELEKIDKMP